MSRRKFSDKNLRDLSYKCDVTPETSQRRSAQRQPLYGRTGPKLDNKFERLLKLNHKSALKMIQHKIHKYQNPSRNLKADCTWRNLYLTDNFRNIQKVLEFRPVYEFG